MKSIYTFQNITFNRSFETKTDEKNISKKPTNKIKQIISDYASLSKYRLSALVVVTSGIGFLCGGSPIDLVTMSSCCIGTALCAASAGTFNQVLEIDRDAKMNRTKNRPLPSKRVSPLNATLWGIFTGISGPALLYATCDPIVAVLGLSNIVLYAGPYTLTKPHYEINTWIGSLVGAIPPVMGYAAATHGVIFAAEPLILSSILFFWQFPHFFALSYLHREDYARGSFQMVATNDPTGQRTANLIREYSVYLASIPVITSIAGLTSFMFLIESTFLNGYLLYLTEKFRSNSSNGNAKRIFLCSLWYLPLLLGAYLFHSRNWHTSDEFSIDKVKVLLF